MNKVYASEQDFTEEGFSQFLPDDILFIVNGKESEHGIAAVTERYNKLKARKAHLEVILPFQEEVRVGNKVFTYYLNHGWMDSEKPELIVTHVAGYIELNRNKINLLNFISVDVETQT
ncbi:hypothetical protein GCM10009069_29990 [Algimonas arctica]|uniref:Uncharacterized protein n=1 Tax=Algimonas arctica TaxID=1479486 RepID=A0A8J3G3H2_9PROT|nr:hypothetical protein [Algimonas arctica]GHB05579.1 hypothetical protein GCM10009069_29990 [Algimonas arctica]